MQMNGNDSDVRSRPGVGRVDEERLHQVHERLDAVSRSLQELNARRESVQRRGAEVRSREAARRSVELANAKLGEIQDELDGLRIAMRNRGVIEQAKGMLMVRLRVDEEKAFDYLRTISNTTNRKLSDVAADVVRTRAGETELR